jgi:hypothetical protein
MAWISQNWVWVLFAVGMLAMHLFGHGRHGGHGDHDEGRNDLEPGGKDSVRRASEQGSGHRH